ncbi:MAG: hypothetical protein D9V47_10900 [Clostridia bacterium]|nr:MAG: hypothetical protein D9V47_10900 [Clostridia bacterium]
MRRRLLTAALGIPGMLLLAYLGGPFWTLAVGVLSLAGYYEFYRLAGGGLASGAGSPEPEAQPELGPASETGSGQCHPGPTSHLQPPTSSTGLWFGVVMNGLLILAAHLGGEAGLLRALVLAGLICAAAPVFLFRSSPWVWAGIFWGILYTGGFLGLAVPLRALGGNWHYLLFVLLLTWANDTTAFFVGRRWGRHPLTLSLSPGKTWEGAAGGVGGCLLVALVAAWVWPWSPGHLLPLAVLLAAGGQVGDLVESAWKRAAGVKDAGTILAGHGGFLDRFDSFIFNVPLAFYYYPWLG